jgi:anion-transporting  ArsA/GET3 family ATPase
MALAKLQELAANPSYDLIVLDTPPDSHALDFLGRPNVLAGFMENKVMTWLIKPFLMAGRLGLGRFISASERLMGGVAKVTGVTALTSFAEFLTLMQEVIEGFHRTGERTVETLKSPHTAFVLVTVPSRAAARAATAIATELKRLGYALSLTVLNRSLPRVIADAARSADASAAAFPERSERPDGPAGRSTLKRRVDGEAAVAAELAAELARLRPGGALPSIRIEEQAGDLGTPAGLGGLATALGEAPALP